MLLRLLSGMSFSLFGKLWPRWRRMADLCIADALVLFVVFVTKNHTCNVILTDTAVQQYSTMTLPRRPRKTTTTTTTNTRTTTTTDSGGCERTQVLMTSSILDDDDEDVQNANTPDELTSSSSVIRLPQLQQHHQQQQQKAFDCPAQIGTCLPLSLMARVYFTAREHGCPK